MMDIQVIDAVTPTTISKEDMRRDFAGSTTCIKSVAPLTAINIIKHRIDYDEETFDNHTINGERYVTVKALVSKDNPMYTFHMNLRRAMKLVEDKCLVTLNTCIKRKVTDEVIENYRFNFKYLEDNKEHSKTDLSIAETASKMLSNINYLKRQVKLKAEDVSLELQLSLNKGFSKRYVKKHFEIANPDIEANNEAKSSLYENITSTPLSTKFNKAVGPNKLEETEDIVNKDLISDRLQKIKDVESNKRSSFRDSSLRESEMPDCNLDSGLNNISIDCPCKVIYYFGDVPLVLCQMCHAYSHLPCLGYKYPRSILQTFLCLKCCKIVGQEYIDIRVKRKFRKEREFIALVQARLMIYIVLKCKSTVNDLIKHLPQYDAKYFVKKMSHMNILHFNNNEYTANKNLIEKKFVSRKYKRAVLKHNKEIEANKMIMKRRKNLETKGNERKKTKTLDTHTTINN